MDSPGELVALLGKRHGNHNEQDGVIPVEGKSKFPYRQFTIIGFCLFAEAVMSGSVLTYSFEMVKDLKGNPYSPFYASLIFSFYTLAETCSATYWMPLSERFGRKPMFLVGLVGLALSSLLVGFAQNYWQALAARTLGGLLNGNISLTPIMIAEMVRKPQYEPVTFAMPSVIWTLGQMAGCLLGGYTAQPAQHYAKFSAHGIFGRFPYLLPNLITAYLLLIASVQGCLLLKESSKKDTTNQEKAHKEVRSIETVRSGHGQRLELHTGSTEHLFTEKSSSTMCEPHDSATSIATSCEKSHSISSSRMTANTLNKKAMLWIAALFLLTFHETEFFSMVPTFMLDPSRPVRHYLDFRGGLGMDLPRVGIYLAFSNIIALLVHSLMLPACNMVASTWSIVMIATFVCPLVYWAIPFVSLLSHTGAGVLIGLSIQRLVTTSARSGLLVLLKGATTDSGRVHAMAMLTCSVARIIAPPFAGMLYGSFGSAAGWWTTALVAVLAITELGFIRTTRKRKHRMSRRTRPTAASEKV